MNNINKEKKAYKPSFFIYIHYLCREYIVSAVKARRILGE